MSRASLFAIGRVWAEHCDGATGLAAAPARGRARLLEHLSDLQGQAPRRSKRGWWVAAAAALIMIVAVGSWWAIGKHPGTEFLVDDQRGQLHAEVAAVHRSLIAFPEGTSVELAAGTRVRVEELDARGARIVLEAGHVSFRVVKRAQARWQLDAGPYSVWVTGTWFDADWEPSVGRLTVSVSRGSVRVGGPALPNGQPLEAGERLDVDTASAQPMPRVSRAEGSAASGSAAPEAGRDSKENTASSAPEVVPSSAPSAVATATGRDVAADRHSPEPTPGDLLATAMRARQSHDLVGAQAAWRECRSRFPGSDEAALSAFWLGRTSVGVSSRPWFAAYLQERPEGPLAADARGRLLESYAAEGDGPAARLVAEEYLRLHPGGPHAGLALRVLGRERP